MWGTKATCPQCRHRRRRHRRAFNLGPKTHTFQSFSMEGTSLPLKGLLETQHLSFIGDGNVHGFLISLLILVVVVLPSLLILLSIPFLSSSKLDSLNCISFHQISIFTNPRSTLMHSISNSGELNTLIKWLSSRIFFSGGARTFN